MTNLNIKEFDLVSDVRAITEEVISDKIEENNSEILFFGDLDVPMQEIDAAIKKLQQLSMHRIEILDDEI